MSMSLEGNVTCTHPVIGMKFPFSLFYDNHAASLSYRWSNRFQVQFSPLKLLP